MGLTSLIWFLLIGLIAGFLASVVMRGGGYGVIGDIIVGIVGALIGGFLLGGSTINQNDFSLVSLLVSFLGAVVLLGVVNLFTRGRVR